MTKYVLNSGGLKKQPERARQFMQEVVSDLGSNVKILLCFFAEPDMDTWQTRFETMSGLLQEWAPEGIKLNCMLATDYENFEKQVEECDVIYLHGGITKHAVTIFSRYNLPEIFHGKVVASNSATTHMLSESFWSGEERASAHGLGIVPIRTIAHYNSSHFGDDSHGPIDWQKAYDELAQYGDTSLPIHGLQEGEFIVVEK